MPRRAGARRRACSSPPPSTTSAGSPTSSRRVERGARERDDLGREPVDDLGGDRVVARPRRARSARARSTRRCGDRARCASPRASSCGRREPEVRRHERARGSCAGRGRPRCAPRRRDARHADVAGRRPSRRVISPSAGKRTCRPSGATPTQLIPAPQTTATPQPRSVPARSTANVSLRDRSSAPPSRARSTALAAARCSSAGKSTPASRSTADVGDGPSSGVARPASREQLLEHRRGSRRARCGAAS